MTSFSYWAVQIALDDLYMHRSLYPLKTSYKENRQQENLASMFGCITSSLLTSKFWSQLFFSPIEPCEQMLCFLLMIMKSLWLLATHIDSISSVSSRQILIIIVFIIIIIY